MRSNTFDALDTSTLGLLWVSR
jgi:hypothetical protein